MARYQPPVHSPMPLGAVLRASFGRDREARARLERLLAARFTATSVLLTGSGTQALQLAIESVAARRPRVALPAYACYDVASAAIGADAAIVLYDIDPDTLAPDPDSFGRALALGVDAVVLAPLYGIPFDVDGLGAIARDAGAEVIEDAAQGHGAAWGGRPLGSFARASVLSFGRGKGWSGGGGGALLTRDGVATERSLDDADDSLTAAARRIGVAIAQSILGRPSLYALPASIPMLELGSTLYHPPQPVRAMPASAIRTALATDAPSIAEAGARRRNAAALRDVVAGIPRLRPIRLDDAATPGAATPGFLRFPVRVSSAAHERVSRGEARRLGVMPGYPTTLAELPEVVSRLVGEQPGWPGATALARELVTLPTHSGLRPPDLERLEAAVRRLV